MCSYFWDFLDDWSTCISDNHYCGNGTQWRRQRCLDQNGNVLSDDNCLFTGEAPLFDTRDCSMNQSCCEFGELVKVDCNSLFLDDERHPPLCVISWSERACNCGDNSDNSDNSNNSDNSTDQSNNFIQCLWTSDMIDNPPISYDVTNDTCPSVGNFSEILTTCYEYSSNETCLSWNVSFDEETGEISNVETPNTTDIGNCNYSTENCWDGWTDWSSCAGTCEEAYQWRRQTSSQGLSFCRHPPSFEYQSCNLTNCCEWEFDESIDWSNCSGPCGQGIQMRFPYTCSCDDESLCPPPEFEFETQDCELNDTTCCKFDLETEPTLCNSTVSWYTQKCICEDSLNGSTCDISNCYGVPLFFTEICDCSNRSSLRYSVEDWKTATWPDNTKNRTFQCSNLTWFELINKSDLDDWESLATEYIAAQLNILTGQNYSELIEDISSTELLLQECTWLENQTQEAQLLQTKLHNFNSDDSHNSLSLAQEDSSNTNSASNANQSSLLFLIFIPAVILVIAAIVVALIFIKKKRQEQEISL